MGMDEKGIYVMEGRLLDSYLNAFLVTGAVTPERLAPICGPAEGLLVT